MARITFEGNFCDISMCRENPCPYNGMCSQRQTWERLKEYEDTGFDPEEIADFMKRWEQTVEIGGMLKKYCIDHIRDLLHAEQDGRLEVLPCKVGDHVWADGREAIVVWFFGYKTGRYLHAQFLDNAECADIPFYEIGKTVFLPVRMRRRRWRRKEIPNNEARKSI